MFDRRLPLLLLGLLPAAALGARQDSVGHTTWDGTRLATLAGTVPSADGAFRLLAGEEASLLLPAPGPFRSLGFFWHGAPGRVQVRLQLADGSFGPAAPLAEAEDLNEGARGPGAAAGDATVGALHHAYGQSAVAALLEFAGPCELQDLSLVWILPETGAVPPPSPAPGAGPRGYPKPPVNDRASWGADPPQCGYSYSPVTHIAIHHTASASEYWSTSWSECASNVKATQSYHMYTNGWCDIGYQYLVCVHGQIWEGRGGGDDVVGAHDGYNRGSMAISNMGYFHAPYNQTLNAAMIDAIGELGAWKCDQQGIDPWGSSYYLGYGGTMTNIYGHRDVSLTACPGDLAYAEMDTIRATIDGKLQGGGGGGNEIILDTASLQTMGTWYTGTSSVDKYGSDYLWTSTGTGSRAAAWWTPSIPADGWYAVYFWWPQGTNRNPATLLGARGPGGTNTAIVDQQHNGGQWNLVGTWWFPAGSSTRVGVVNDGASGWVVIADALRLVPQ